MKKKITSDEIHSGRLDTLDSKIIPALSGVSYKETTKETEEEKKKRIDDLKKKLDDQSSTIIRNRLKERSIIDDLKEVKSDKTYTEDEVREKINDISFMNEAMKKLNSSINEQAKTFYNLTKDYKDIEEDKSLSITLKIIPNKDRDKIIFREKLISYGEKRRPIMITIGQHELFFMRIDENGCPLFEYSKKNLFINFKNDIDSLIKYIQENKCYIGTNTGKLFPLKMDFSFDDLCVEVIDKKKKKNEDKPKEDIKEDIKENDVKEEKVNNINKIVYKVEFKNKNSLFILTEDPSNIFKQFNDLSVIKVMGEGVNV